MGFCSILRWFRNILYDLTGKGALTVLMGLYGDD